MGHNLNMKNNRAAMMYVGDKPWHGLGTKLDNPATAKEAIEAAQMDYKVELQPIYLDGRKEITEHKASVRMDTKQSLGIVGNRYQIIQNVEAFNFFDVIVGEGQAIYHTAGALGKGERIWLMAKLPGELIVAREDIVEKYLILTNSHDGTSSLRMYFSPVRVVCQNTLNISMRNMSNSITIRHTGDVMKKSTMARKALGIAINYYSQFESIAKQMVDIKLSPKQADKYYDAVLNIGQDDDEASTIKVNQKEEMIALFHNGKGNNEPDVRGSLWGAMNGVSEWTDHYKTVKGMGEDRTKKLTDIWFGTAARIKQRAYEEALVLVGK